MRPFPPNPYCASVLPHFGDDYFACVARHLTQTINHPVGTCRMGRDDDGEAVLDPRLRVRGVQRLRVADASVMPRLVSGNTHAPTVMIGERAAQLILEDWTGSEGWEKDTDEERDFLRKKPGKSEL